MSTGIATIVKARLIHLIDGRLQDPKQSYLDEMKGATALSDLALQLGFVEGDGTDHVDVEAFGEDVAGAWWGHFPKKAEIVQAGYRQALELALQYTPAKPIVTYWVRDLPRFEVIVSDSVNEVHVFWLTPKAPAPNPPPAGNEFYEDMWLVATPERVDEVLAKLPDDYEITDPIELEGIEGVQVFRLVGY